MTTQVDTLPEPVRTPPRATRPFYWSIRRELWENRSLYIAPLAAAAVTLFGFAIGDIWLLRRMSALDQERRSFAVGHYDLAALVIMLTMLLAGVFYCLGALHGERRDRSILFWKSLPVSDLTTVLAKASVPLVILPLLGFIIIVATQLIMLMMSTALLLLNGISATALWVEGPLSAMSLVQLYCLAVLALWYAPFGGWLLLVSGSARRAVFLWAFLPPLAVCVIEKTAFGTTNVAAFLIHRLAGGYDEAFTTRAEGASQLATLDPVRYLSSPDLWIGLAITAAFLATAVWLRRRREPI